MTTLIEWITEYFSGDEASKSKLMIKEFDTLSPEDKIKNLSWYYPYIQIVAKDYQGLPCFGPNHYFSSKMPKVGELCNCGQYSYREDGYGQCVALWLQQV